MTVQMTIAPPIQAPMTAMAIMVFLPRPPELPADAPEEVSVEEADADDCVEVWEAVTVIKTVCVPEVDTIVLTDAEVTADEEEERVDEVAFADDEADADPLEAEGVADPIPGMLSPILNGLELEGLATGAEPLGETTDLVSVSVAVPAPEFVGALGSPPAPITGTSGPVIALTKSGARFLSIRA